MDSRDVGDKAGAAPCTAYWHVVLTSSFLLRHLQPPREKTVGKAYWRGRPILRWLQSPPRAPSLLEEY